MTGPNSSKDMSAWSLANPAKSRAYFEYALLCPAAPMSCVNMASPTYLRLLRVRSWLHCDREQLEKTEPHPRVQVIARPRPRSTWLPVPRPLHFAEAEGPFFVLDPAIDNTYRRWMWNGMRLRIVYGDLLKQSLQRQTVAERPKLSCIRDTFSVLGHTRAVIAVYILFHRVTRYILYRFKVTRSLHFASNLQYSPSHPLEAPYYAFCVRLSLNLFHFEPDPGLIQM